MPGSLVSDALADSTYRLNDGGASTSSEAGSDGWVQYEWPNGVAQLEVALGTCSGTDVVAFVTVEASDASDGSNPVVCGSAGPFSGTSDDTTYRMPVYIGPRGKYVQCYINIAAGTSPSITPTVTLQEMHYQATATTTAGDASS